MTTWDVILLQFEDLKLLISLINIMYSSIRYIMAGKAFKKIIFKAWPGDKSLYSTFSSNDSPGVLVIILNDLDCVP